MGLLSQVSRQLARKGRLPCSLEPGKHNHGGWMLGVPQAPCLSTEDSHKLFVDDLDDLLRRIQRPRDLRGERTLLDSGTEFTHNGERDIGIKERDPDLAYRLIDVVLGQATLAPQIAERGRQPIRQ